MKRGVLLLTLGAAVATAVVAAALVGAVGPSGAKASSHREAPLIADDPAADNTDVYAFVSPNDPPTSRPPSRSSRTTSRSRIRRAARTTTGSIRPFSTP